MTSFLEVLEGRKCNIFVSINKQLARLLPLRARDPPTCVLLKTSESNFLRARLIGEPTAGMPCHLKATIKPTHTIG